jgi:phage FluMu protein gp41
MSTLTFNEYTIEYEIIQCDPTAWNNDTFEYCVESVVYTDGGDDAWDSVSQRELELIEREIQKVGNSIPDTPNHFLRKSMGF